MPADKGGEVIKAVTAPPSLERLFEHKGKELVEGRRYDLDQQESHAEAR
jgi:hypothetical protein